MFGSAEVDVPLEFISRAFWYGDAPVWSRANEFDDMLLEVDHRGWASTGGSSLAFLVGRPPAAGGPTPETSTFHFINCSQASEGKQTAYGEMTIPVPIEDIRHYAFSDDSGALAVLGKTPDSSEQKIHIFDY